MLDKKINKISAKNSNVAIGDNVNIQNVKAPGKVGWTSIISLIAAIITLVAAIIKFLAK